MIYRTHVTIVNTNSLLLEFHSIELIFNGEFQITNIFHTSQLYIGGLHNCFMNQSRPMLMFVLLLLSTFTPLMADEVRDQQSLEYPQILLSGSESPFEVNNTELSIEVYDEAYVDTSISIDSLGHVHLVKSESYYDDGLIPSSLIYSTNSSGSWVSITIDDVGQFTDSSMALDSNDKIHITYQSINGLLKYATNLNGIWETSIIQDIHPDMFVGYSNNIFIDENNHVHVSYANTYYQTDPNWGSKNQLIMYANNIEGFWNITESSYVTLAYDTAVVVDSDMHVYIGYYRFDYFLIHHNNTIDGDWTSCYVLSGASSKFSFEIDSNDVIHITYVIGSRTLGYASQSADNLPTSSSDYFETTIIDQNLGYYGGKNSMTIDSKNNLHVAYYDDENLAIKYATMRDNGLWNISSIDSINQIDTYYSSIDIAVEQNGNAHMFYQTWQWSDTGYSEGLMKYSRISYLDLDGDGVNYIFDKCPDINPLEFDLDGDGCVDDDDGDGIGNSLDQCEGYDDIIDIDQDGIVDGCDDLIDNDDDGVANEIDQFPEDSSEINDSDSDGIGDNADEDDDNDGVQDNLDAFPNNASESSDTDGDGIGNNADDDDDNDGYTDALETSFQNGSLCSSDPLDSNSTPLNNSLINSSDYAYMEFDETGLCEIYYDLDGDEIIDLEDMCPNEFANTTDGCPIKVEEVVSDSSSSDTIMIVSGTIGFIILGAVIVMLVIRRRRESELENEFDEDERLYEQMSSSGRSWELELPPVTARGEITDGYETIEYPKGSDNWYYRDHDTGKWNQWT